MNYKLIETSSDLDSALTLLSESEFLAIDTETTALRPFDGKLRLIQLKTIKDDRFIVDCFKFNLMELAVKLNPILEAKKLIAHNLKFDIQWLKYYLLTEPKIFFDTYIASVLLDLNDKHKLGRVLERYLGIYVDKTEQKSDWSGILSQSQYEYALNDIEYLIPLREKLIEGLKETKQLGAMQLEMEVLPVVADMEIAGVPVNKKIFQNLIDSLEQDKIRNTKRLKEWFLTNGGKSNNYNVLTQVDLFGNEVEVETEDSINLRSQAQLLKKFNELGIDIECTDAKILKPLKRKYPELSLLLDFRESQKLCSTYGQKFLDEYVNPRTGRIHSSFFQVLTKTKRFSSADINMQNLPAQKRFREIFALNDENYRLNIADLSQFELRVLAELSNDQVMLETFNNDKDLHSITAARAFNLPVEKVKKEYPEERKKGKVANFSIVYGIGKYALAMRFEADGVKCDEEEAGSIITAFHDSFPDASKWLKQQKQRITKEPWIRTIGGHLIRVDFDKNDPASIAEAERFACNAPIQSFNSVAIKVAMVELHKKLKDYKDSKLILTVHDELLVESRVEDAKEVDIILKQCMIDGAKKYLKNVKVEVESAIGMSWADKA